MDFGGLPFVVRDYILYETISHGAFGTVFKAKHIKYNRDFAIKVVPMAKKNGERTYSAEIKALMNLDHPGIVRVYQNFSYDDYFFIVYELCVCTLADEILYNNPSFERRLSLLKQVASALSFCHDHNICHRDIKPTNVLIDDNGNAKLGDFGLAMVFNDLNMSHNYARNQDGSENIENNEDVNMRLMNKNLKLEKRISRFEGSPLYCPPEILLEKVHNPFMADVWSFGVLVYFMFSGDVPWAKQSMKELKLTVCNRNLYIPPVIPKKMGILIYQCLKLTPTKRWSMDEINDYLCKIRSGNNDNSGSKKLSKLNANMFASSSSTPAVAPHLTNCGRIQAKMILESSMKTFPKNHIILRPIVKFV